jgi:uncharacterized membrane protein (UPF0182 family)
MQRRKTVLIILAVLLFVVLPLLWSFLDLAADWLFFIETGYTAVFTTILSTQIGLGTVFGLVLFAFVMANAKIAQRRRFPRRELFFMQGAPQPFTTDTAGQFLKPLVLVSAVVIAFLAGLRGSQQWQSLLLFLEGQPIGVSDPILGHDLSFYIFTLPFVDTIQGYFGFTLVLTIIVTALLYFLRGGLIVSDRGLSLDPAVKRHLALLAGLFLLNMAVGFYLDTFRILYSDSGVVYGAGYADVNARLPVYRVLAIVSVISAVSLVAGIWKGSWRLAVLPPAAGAALYVLGIMVYPSALQQFKVAPNELALETPYIAHNIRFTRLGFDLDKIQVIPFDVNYTLTTQDIERNDATIKNVRLWDHAPLLRTYSQLQQIRTYYKFFDVDNDRYTVNNEYLQVMLSPRELSYNDLPSRNWINERLIFTHGNGVTLGPVSRISREGLPEFIVKDIPPASVAPETRITRPEIYYGELSNDYVIVKTRVPEFSYPTTEKNIYTTYEGRGGVGVGSLAKRAFFAAVFKSEKILLSSDIQPQSRILYYRNIANRVRVVAPFLLFEQDPYMVIRENGRLTWIIDAFTTSNRLPYSRPLNRVNYIRNSVKVVIDAYDGTIDFYVSDPADFLIRTYDRIFPALFKPLSAMPQDLRRHIRYPHRFLQVQASVFASYHMTDPQVFYNRENLWEVPQTEEQIMEPYYTVMKLPGEKKEEYILLMPFSPAKRNNLAAWLTARCDEPNYGKILAYTFPRDRLIFGPKQIDARINQDSAISQQLTLWSQRGSQVIRGSMLIIPIERSLLYIQPLYLSSADKGGLPELRRVIVAYENEVVMEENLELALFRLFGGRRPEQRPSTRAVPEQAVPAGELAKQALGAYERALELQRQGNWSGYGEQLKRLEEILRRMAK